MMRLTSSTAPGTYFESREELAEHYHSDWHRYNLRRRQAGLKPVTSVEFQAKLSAARTVQLEKSTEKSRAHLKNKNKEKKGGKEATATANEPRPPSQAFVLSDDTDDDKIAHNLGPAAADADADAGADALSAQGDMPLPHVEPAVTATTATNRSLDGVLVASTDSKERATSDVEEEVDPGSSNGTPVEIDPKRCLFDRHVSATVKDNVAHMHRQYGFFVPDVEHLVDLSGFVGYCHEKILLGRTCLWCQHVFVSAEACVSHMKSKGHTKILYEAGVDLDEWDVFYDFTETNREFLSNLENNGNSGGGGRAKVSDDDDDDDMQVDGVEGGGGGDDDDDDDDGWEDMSDGAGADNEDEDYRGYEEEVGRMGITISDLGEIVFPDGRIVGHRSLRRYYKQNLAPYRQHKLEDTSIAVRAARIAAGERLYKGRVYNVYAADNTSGSSGRALTASSKMAASMAAMGLRAPTGRAGQGILVPVTSSSSASSSAALSTPLDYSKLSIYRYRAAVRKARYGEDYGRRLWLRSNTNLNRMDKKANRLANGVSVAHAAR